MKSPRIVAVAAAVIGLALAAGACGGQSAASPSPSPTTTSAAVKGALPTYVDLADDIAPIGVQAAFDRAFEEEERAFEAVRWSEELKDAPVGVAQNFEREGRYVDSRTILVACPPEAAFDPIACIGGENGWYAFDTLWDIRGFVDVLLGGPGRRRGRTDPYALVEGVELEWWRVQ